KGRVYRTDTKIAKKSGIKLSAAPPNVINKRFSNGQRLPVPHTSFITGKVYDVLLYHSDWPGIAYYAYRDTGKNVLDNASENISNVANNVDSLLRQTKPPNFIPLPGRGLIPR
ncbi:hypothetical protein, partial [Roseibium sp. RKSG952]|uniref:hypothetical protein n=1 Tax=Roseibium sp. RKSG952 TaxID=2529384 RepID=UPI001AD8FCC0